MEENTIPESEVKEAIAEAKEPTITVGHIDYRIIENADGSWQVEYESSAENDLAAMAITQHLSEVIVANLVVNRGNIDKLKRYPENATIKQKSHVDSLATKQKRHIDAIITKGKAARFGLKMLIDYMQPLYAEFKKKREAGNEKN
jgi:pheromone shutdown protein TraB